MACAAESGLPFQGEERFVSWSRGVTPRYYYGTGRWPELHTTGELSKPCARTHVFGYRRRELNDSPSRAFVTKVRI
jgi:hypothetical protein